MNIDDLLDDIFCTICENITEPAGCGCGYGITSDGEKEVRELLINYLENNMNDVNLVMSQHDNFSFVQVSFNDGSARTYTYKTLLDLEVGDALVVEVDKLYKVVRVVETDVAITDMSLNYKWVVDKVDTTQYNQCLEVEKAVQASINKSRIKQLQKQFQEDLSEAIGSDAAAKQIEAVKAIKV